MKDFNFINRRKRWYTISLIIIGLGILSLLFQGLNLGIDFVGGTVIEYGFPAEVTEIDATTEDIHEILKKFNVDESSKVVRTHDPEGFFIKTVEMQPAKIQDITDAIQADYPEIEQLKVEQVGPTIGKELRWKALLAILVASIAIIAYISFRFEFKYAMAAIVALLHDVAIVVGLFSIFQFELNTPFIAAALTIVGYSINDTIVIFDKVRENVKFMQKSTLAEVANKAILETLPRSINTSLTTMLTVLAILIFGGTSIKVFMTALLFGVLAGTYSSIFVAAPLLVTWKNKIANNE